MTVASKHHHRHTPAPRPATPPVVHPPTASPAASSKPVAVSADAIRYRAYQLWEAAGRPAGDGVTFWVQAERELNAR